MPTSPEALSQKYHHICEYAPEGYNHHAGQIVGNKPPFEHCIVKTDHGLRVLRLAQPISSLAFTRRNLSPTFRTPSDAATTHERHLAALTDIAGINHLDTHIVGVRDHPLEDGSPAGFYYASKLLPKEAVNLDLTDVDASVLYTGYGLYGAWAHATGERVVLSDLDRRDQHHVLQSPTSTTLFAHDPEPIYAVAMQNGVVIDPRIYDSIRGLPENWLPLERPPHRDELESYIELDAIM